MSGKTAKSRALFGMLEGMRSPRSPKHLRVSFAVSLSCLVAPACATGEVCQRDMITGREECDLASSNAGEAIGTAVAAGAAWGVAGCTVNGCPPPFRCSAGGRVCERTPCGEAHGACPAGYACDPEELVCR